MGRRGDEGVAGRPGAGGRHGIPAGPGRIDCDGIAILPHSGASSLHNPGSRPENGARMIINLCQACRRVNAADAKRCDHCGAYLDEADTQPLPLRTTAHQPDAGALWLDELLEPRRRAPARVEPEAPELAITLREVEAAAPASATWTAPPAHAAGQELVVSDIEPRPHLVDPPPAVQAPAQPAPAAPPALPKAVRATRKAERRAAVRRSRQRGAPAGTATVSEVLVFDAHDGERDRLCTLLRSFGFGVHAVDRADKAAALAATHGFVAAFVDIALDARDGGAGIDLCKQVRAASHKRGGSETLLVLVTARLQPMDRVRAELAGCEETVIKPVTRGSVAGVLDARGIVLPTDPRQG